MKIKYLILILFLVPVKLSYAEEISVYHYGFQENSDTYLFGDNVRVRKDPVVKEGNIVDTLGSGDKIKIIKKTDLVMALDGYKEYWYKISFSRNNKITEGYVWGGLFSIGYSAIGGKQFLAGIKKYSSESGFTAECRLVEKGRIISSVLFSPHYLNDGNNEGFYGYSVTAELAGGHGLEGIENTFRIFCNYEACGYPRGNIWIGYGKDRLYYIGNDTSISEAGVFHVEEKYIFPADNKSVKGEVLLVNESYDFDESISDYKLTEKKETRFIWKNYKLEPVK